MKRILLVDDDAASCEAATAILLELECAVENVAVEARCLFPARFGTGQHLIGDRGARRAGVQLILPVAQTGRIDRTAQFMAIY